MNTVTESRSYEWGGMNEIMHTALESTGTSDPLLCYDQNHLVSTFYILQNCSSHQIAN